MMQTKDEVRVKLAKHIETLYDTKEKLTSMADEDRISAKGWQLAYNIAFLEGQINFGKWVLSLKSIQ